MRPLQARTTSSRWARNRRPAPRKVPGHRPLRSVRYCAGRAAGGAAARRRALGAGMRILGEDGDAGQHSNGVAEASFAAELRRHRLDAGLTQEAAGGAGGDGRTYPPEAGGGRGPAAGRNGAPPYAGAGALPRTAGVIRARGAARPLARGARGPARLPGTAGRRPAATSVGRVSDRPAALPHQLRRAGAGAGRGGALAGGAPAADADRRRRRRARPAWRCRSRPGALAAYPDGVWLVELAALADPALVPAGGGRRVGVREEPGRPAAGHAGGGAPAAQAPAAAPGQLRAPARTPAPRLADALLRACPARARPGHQPGGARASPASGDAAACPPLAAARTRPGAGDRRRPWPRCEAVRLFVERARGGRAGLRPHGRRTRRRWPSVCRRLDGLPLALELAAARVRVLPVEQLAGAAGRPLPAADRREPHARPPRQQTLRATLDWSYDLLDRARSGRCSRRLAVFAGGLDAGGGRGGRRRRRDVTRAAVLDLLTRLVDTVAGAGRGAGRGAARATGCWRRCASTPWSGWPSAARRRRCASGTPALLPGAGGAGRAGACAGRSRSRWLERLEAEHDNLRAALRWCLERGGAPTRRRRCGWPARCGASGSCAGTWREGRALAGAGAGRPGREGPPRPCAPRR